MQFGADVCGQNSMLDDCPKICSVQRPCEGIHSGFDLGSVSLEGTGQRPAACRVRPANMQFI